MYREIDYIDLSKVFPGVEVERVSNVWKYIYIGMVVITVIALIALIINPLFI